MQKNRKRGPRVNTVNKVIACVLSLVFVLITCVVPVYAEEQIETTPSRIPLTELEKTIDSYVESYEKYTAAVSVVAIKDGEFIVNKAYGFANIENQRKADTSTVLSGLLSLNCWSIRVLCSLSNKGSLIWKRILENICQKDFSKAQIR